MKSCIPIRQIVINNSLNDLSSFDCSKNTKFTRATQEEGYFQPDIIKTTGDNGKTFKISGEIKLRKDGQIKWNKSVLSEIEFKDTCNNLNDFHITDRWQYDYDLRSLIKSSPKSYIRTLLNKGFELRGGDRQDVIDLVSAPILKKNIWLPISGGAGADTIIGSNKDDYLAASTSRDICDFGSGTNLARKTKDVLTGNGGKDTFYADNGTRVTDIEEEEVIHLLNHDSYDLGEIISKTPSFINRRNKTIIRVGDIKIITNKARFNYSYKFYTPEHKLCRSDSLGTVCDMGWIPGEPEGYSFTAVEVF